MLSSVEIVIQIYWDDQSSNPTSEYRNGGRWDRGNYWGIDGSFKKYREHTAILFKKRLSGDRDFVVLVKNRATSL